MSRSSQVLLTVLLSLAVIPLAAFPTDRVFEAALAFAPEHTRQQRYNKQDEEDKEQDLGDAGGRAGDGAEAEDAGDERNDEEEQGPIEHGCSG